MKDLCQNWKVKLIFREVWNSLVAWSDWPRPLILRQIYATDLIAVCWELQLSRYHVLLRVLSPISHDPIRHRMIWLWTSVNQTREVSCVGIKRHVVFDWFNTVVSHTLCSVVVYTAAGTKSHSAPLLCCRYHDVRSNQWTSEFMCLILTNVKYFWKLYVNCVKHFWFIP